MKRVKYCMCIAAAVLLLGGCGERENQDIPGEATGLTESAGIGEGSSEGESQSTEGDRLQVRTGSKVPDAFLEEEEMDGYEKRELKIAENPMLRAVGKVLRDNAGQGEVVQLRGTNAGGYLLQEFWMTTTAQSENVYAEEEIYAILEERFGRETREELVALYQDHYWTEEDFDYCQEIGMNCIRLPFWYRNLVDEKGEFYENWSRRLDWFVEEAGKRGVYVILDLHGAPGSQNGSDHSGKDGRDEKEKASEFFFGEYAKENQELYYRIWEAVAEHFKDNPWVAAYDLLNEPYGTYRYDASLSADELHQLLWGIYDTAYRRIRQIDQDHVIIMEAVWDPIDLPDPKEYSWENVMYEYHNYCWGDYDNLQGQQVEYIRGRLNQIRLAGYDVPCYLGEFTFFTNLTAWEKALALVDDFGMSWTTWTYKTTEGNGYWGIRSQKNGRLNLETADLEEIRETWSEVDQSSEHVGLRLVLEKFYKRVYIPAR